MSMFKNRYKELYNIELNNRKLYERRYNEIKKINEELQKSTGFAELRKENLELTNEVLDLKIENAKLKIELEDTNGFLQQEKRAKEYLLRERKGRRNYGRRKKEVLQKK